VARSGLHFGRGPRASLQAQLVDCSLHFGMIGNLADLTKIAFCSLSAAFLLAVFVLVFLQFGHLQRIGHLRHDFMPNYSLKRTNQSLRD